MKNLNFLNVGEIFPPLEEAKRIGNYADYDLMYDGNTYAVEFKDFKERLRKLNRLAVMLGWSKEYLSVEYNYFNLCSLKTADFVCGEIPDITVSDEDKQAIVEQIRRDTKFDIKHYDTWVNVSKYGEMYWRVYKRDGKYTFTLQSPSMIFRVTDAEDDYEIKQYVVAWVSDDGTKLNVQIHEKGSYIARVYSIANVYSHDLSTQNRFKQADGRNEKIDMFQLLYDRYTDEVFRCTAFKITAILSEERISTGLDDFAIIPIFNAMNSDNTHGRSDYAAFDSIVSQMQATMTEVQLIFDKFTVPTFYGASELSRDVGDEHIFEIGTFLGIPEGGTIPGVLEPDLNKLQQYFTQLQFNVERIKELSEMGAALTNDTQLSNISTETMKASYSSALKKAERLTTRNTDAVKKLFHLLATDRGVDIAEDDITVTWYDGLPNDEEKDTRVATAKVQSGLSNRKTEFINRFNHTEEEFEEMWTQWLNEQSDVNTVGSVGNTFNPFGQDNGEVNADGNKQPTGGDDGQPLNNEPLENDEPQNANNSVDGNE
jgi:ATP-dependent Clp protease adapter protein ClpS